MDPQLIFVTGKGGVGKSLVAAATALNYSRKGKKTLLVELGDQSYFQAYFKTPEISYKPLNLKKNFDVALWTGEACLREYILYLVKSEKLVDLFFKNKVTRALLNVAPALQELSIMGKLTSSPRKYGPPLPYDVIVVDGYATGHFLSLLRAPLAMAQAIPFGPMGEQSRSIDKTLRDPKICEYKIVTLPEELPFKESEELAGTLLGEFGIRSEWILNKMVTTTLKSNDLATRDPHSFAHFLGQILSRQEDILSRISQVKMPTKEKSEMHVVPLIMSFDPWERVEKTAEAIL